ncbi:MAG: hypothetical protein LQ346_000736 [Caloplaca aetnensis]|nr:MAG: hypothetical protein LQ346_000736 [Caloplaca aetnensis]
MPGRQSIGPLSLSSRPSKARNTKRKKDRSFNALAIAEKANPERTKIRRHRLGESEPDRGPKRKRRLAQHESSDNSDDGDDGKNPSEAKKRKVRSSASSGGGVDYGSDSEGNEWMLGGVASDDNSSLDSDEAMGNSDAEKFADFAFRGSSSTGQRRKGRGSLVGQETSVPINLCEDEKDGNDGGEEDDLGEEAVGLATMLDRGTEDEMTESFEPDAGSIYSAEDKTNPSSGDEASTMTVSDDENDAHDPAKLEALQSLVQSMNDHDEAQTSKRKVPDINESNAPSEYGLSSKQKLTIADLLPSVKDPQLKKSLRILADDDTKSSSKRTGIAKKLDVPLPKRQQDRLDRAAAYEKSKETLDRWIDTVKHNRRAEHLSFPLQDPDAANARGGNKLDRHAKPLTTLEAAIQNILQDSGLAPKSGKSEEEQIQAFEELEASKLPLEEVQARRSELRKARDLLFREEIRAKRINKIKSKSYRRIHRKERERLVQKDKEELAAAGVADSESEKERKDRRRAEERMGAKHRESRWAKEVKGSGRMAWDMDARAGIEEMARREEDLKRKIMGRDADDSDAERSSEDEDEDEDEDGEDAEAGEDKTSRALQNRLQRFEEDQGNLEAEVRQSTSALSSMKFMQNAEAGRKASNDEALQQMRRELAGEETPSEEEPDDGPGRRSYGPTRNAIQPAEPKVVVQRNEFEERQSSGDEEGRATRPDEEDLQIIVDDKGSAELARSTKEDLSLSGRQRKRGAGLSFTQSVGQVEENPWLSGGKPKTNARSRKSQDVRAAAIISNELPDRMASAAPIKFEAKPAAAVARTRQKSQAQPSPAQRATTPNDNASDVEAEDIEEQSAAPFVLRNQDLVRRAFAGDDVVANFEKEKEETMQSEDEKMIDNTLAGWGAWVGAGIGKKAQKRNKNRFLSKQEGVPKAKRQDAKLDKVIINEKRVKKNAKYLASQLPHPFETRQQYERSLRLPVGPEWTTKETFQAVTKPRVLMKQGIITPLAKPII